MITEERLVRLFCGCVFGWLIGIVATGIIDKHGRWHAYGQCLIHHTPDECKGAKP